MPGNFDRTFAMDFIKGLDSHDQQELDGLPGWMFKNFVIYIDTPNQSSNQSSNTRCAAPSPDTETANRAFGV
jgi:DNA ligase-4